MRAGCKNPPKSTKLCYLDFKIFSVPSFHTSLLIEKNKKPLEPHTAIVSVGILCEAVQPFSVEIGFGNKIKTK